MRGFVFMKDDEILISNVNKIHTTKMGIDRIKNNLNIESENVIEYCKRLVLNENCLIYKLGKNWYCEINHIRLTINANSFTIITAHTMK